MLTQAQVDVANGEFEMIGPGRNFSRTRVEHAAFTTAESMALHFQSISKTKRSSQASFNAEVSNGLEDRIAVLAIESISDSSYSTLSAHLTATDSFVR